MRKRVVVYCSSRNNLDKEIIDGSRKIASLVGIYGAELVYGGVNAGLMHEIAEAAHENGAKITGVVPEVFRSRADKLCDEVIFAKDLNNRKGIMISKGDIFIVLPGGIGTIDEWISTLSDIMVREKVEDDADRPILVWNYRNMYSDLCKQLNETSVSVFARGKRVDRSLIYTDIDDFTESLKKHLD